MSSATIKHFDFQLNEDKFTVAAEAKNINNPSFDFVSSGSLNLDQFAKLMPADSKTKFGGNMWFKDLSASGKLSDIATENYQNVIIGGQMGMDKIFVVTPALPYRVEVKKALLGIAPQAITLNNFDIQVGKSDLSMSGDVRNYLGYFLGLKDSTLHSTVAFTSSLLDVNELLRIVPETEGEEASNLPTTTTSTEVETGALLIPSNLDIVMQADAKKVEYTNIHIDDMIGKITVKNGKVTLEQLKLNTLKGSVVMNGSVVTSANSLPSFDMKLNVAGIDIGESMSTFASIKQLVPVAENAFGSVSTQLAVTGSLTPDLGLDYNTLQATANLQVLEAGVNDIKMLDVLSKLSKDISSNDIQLKNVAIKTRIENGLLMFDPFTIPMGKNNLTLNGTNSLTGAMNYDGNLSFPKDGVTSNVYFKVTGSFDDVKISLVNKDGQTVKEQTKAAVSDAKEELKIKTEEKKEEIKAEMKEKADEKKEELKNDLKDKLKDRFKK